MTTRKTREQIDVITKRLCDEGKLVEAGWVGFQMMVLPLDAPPIQVEQMRVAFFGGAQHLFGSLTGAMEEDDEPTDTDIRRMNNINDELQAFIATLKARGHG